MACVRYQWIENSRVKYFDLCEIHHNPNFENEAMIIFDERINKVGIRAFIHAIVPEVNTGIYTLVRVNLTGYEKCESCKNVEIEIFSTSNEKRGQRYELYDCQCYKRAFLQLKERIEDLTKIHLDVYPEEIPIISDLFQPFEIEYLESKTLI